MRDGLFQIGTVVTGWNYADIRQVYQPILSFMNFFQKTLTGTNLDYIFKPLLNHLIIALLTMKI
ncbi:MAG: hypothetical protein A2Z19_08120 [Deltaproteobacteria bacterium RBG_16_54_18]|nr:MAG: hypothetical protein A2Z19_08120 [Deltaproteobacteria bacterium RBG_16_54_18]